jgi:hypothetical protein
MLNNYGYSGMTVDIGNAVKLANLVTYQSAAKKVENFKFFLLSIGSTLVKNKVSVRNGCSL